MWTQLADLHYILKRAPMDIPLGTGLSVCSDFSQVHLEPRIKQSLALCKLENFFSDTFMKTTHLETFCLGGTPELIKMFNPVINTV